MLAPAIANSFRWSYSNYDAASNTVGTSVTPGASSAEGNWTQIASGANIAQSVYGVFLLINSGATSASAKNHIIDIGYDPAGGSSYTAKITDLIVGQSAAYGGQLSAGRAFYFPLSIPPGSTVAVRVQGSSGTAGTIRVGATFYGRPTRPEMIRSSGYSETIGAVASTLGVSFTPGNSGAEGAWTSLGTTTRDLWWFQLGVQLNNATFSLNTSYQFDLAYGDGTNMHMIIENHMATVTTAESLQTLLSSGECLVPAGSTLYVRGSCANTADTGWNANAVGIG